MLCLQHPLQHQLAVVRVLLRQARELVAQLTITLWANPLVPKRHPANANQRSCTALAKAVMALEVGDDRAAAWCLHHSLPITPFSVALSSSASASSRLSFAFSGSGSRRRLASDTSMQSNFDFQRYRLCFEKPCRRVKSASETPASCPCGIG